jgi:hypothetical protein
LVGSEFNMYGTGALTELSITEALSTATPLTVKGAASQTADLTQWQNSAGTTLASIAPVTANDAVTMLVSGNIVSNATDAGRLSVVSIGSGSYVGGNDSVAIGASAYTTADNAVAIGRQSNAVESAIALGSLASAISSNGSVAIGRNSSASHYCVVIGNSATADDRGVAVGVDASSQGGNSSIAIGNQAKAQGAYSLALGKAAGAVTYDQSRAIRIGQAAEAYENGIAIGIEANAPKSGLVVVAGIGNSILSGQFNSSTSHTDGFLNVLDNNLQVSGDGSVKVNNQYTFPTGVTASNDYVLTAQTDGTTAWASAAGGGSPGGSDTQVQFNGGGDFEGDSALVWNSGTNVLTISGHLAATTKSFLIDHPTKPEKQLQYACLEGPENGVYVRGHTNDSIIDLPDYWTALVDQDSITVQITAKDAPQPYLYVSGVANNQVHLISDRSVSAYYTVNGTRKDVEPLLVEPNNYRGE